MLRSLSLIGFFCLPAALCQTVDRPLRAVTDQGVITTRQTITPAGVPTVFQGRVHGLAFGSTPARLWVLTAHSLYHLDWQRNVVLARYPFQGRPGLQGLAFDSQTSRPFVTGAGSKNGVWLATVENGVWRILAQRLGSHIAGALSLVPGKHAAVPLIYDNKLAIVDPAGGAKVRLAPVPIAPFGVAVDRAGAVAYVTNWGGRLPKPGEHTATTGLDPGADRVVVDQRGIASTGTVTRVDLAAGLATHTIAVQLHPTALLWNEAANRLYVANSNSDSVSVIDTAANTVVTTIEIQPFARPVAGIAPAALALSGDGRTLFVACGGINAIAQVRLPDGIVEGLIPTAWYPNALSLSPDGRQLAVATLLGAGSGWRGDPRRRFVHSYRGSVAVLPLPDRNQLASYTASVAENNRMPTGARHQAPVPDPNARPVAVPQVPGEHSLIDHVVYIVKENRTYDQVLGDMPQGNGDPSLVMFGKDVTPNHHKLASQYVLLDNFYASGGNSADGHQWLTQANEVSYALWPGYTGRSYPFDGSDPIAYSASGFLWDAALAKDRTVRVYGEYAGKMSEENPRQRIALLNQWRDGADFTRRWNITAPIASLNRILAANYPSYTNAIPDVVRASIFLADVARWQREGSMPNLVIVQLNCDHTFGALPGTSTPSAMVADNDLALGLVIEALSKTTFWKKMAVFVVEDDAQNGVDHVDGHRTVALMAGPYVRRGHVDSTFYANQSMVKTIELILGLPTLTLFDLIANDMRASFTDTPDFTPYAAERPRQSLWDLNPEVKSLRGPARAAALASSRMRFDAPDAAPTERLNRILWGVVRGWKTPYPGTRNAVFAPLSLDVDDENRDQLPAR